VIDPAERWRRHHGVDSGPAWAGLLTFGGLPYTEDPAELAGVDVAIVGAPMDDLVSDAPGTRFGPRAVRGATPTSAYHLEARVDWSKLLRVIDYGDAPILPTDAVASHRAIESTVNEVVTAGALPIVLGGDHSITEPDVKGCTAAHGQVGLVHFDTHTDTAAELYGRELSHGTPMYRLVEQGHVDPRRYVQIGLRGW
jgi:agmatinase